MIQFIVSAASSALLAAAALVIVAIIRARMIKSRDRYFYFTGAFAVAALITWAYMITLIA